MWSEEGNGPRSIQKQKDGKSVWKWLQSRARNQILVLFDRMVWSSGIGEGCYSGNGLHLAGRQTAGQGWRRVGGESQGKEHTTELNAAAEPVRRSLHISH